MKKAKVIYMPYPYMDVEANEMLRNTVDMLEEKYDVVGRMDPSLDLTSLLETRAIILNWAEQWITEEQKAQILKYQEFGTRIIWFFHNRTAHEQENVDKETDNMVWLADHSDYIAILSKSSRQYVPGKETNKDKVRYVPHVQYHSRVNARITEVLRNKYQIKEDEFVYCIFGLIRPYKNIEMAIKCFGRIQNDKTKLIIAGKPITEAYAQEIARLSEKLKNIITDFRFLSDMELDCLIELSDIVLMTYTGVSSMNSGVLIKAFSDARTVIAPAICMVNDICEERDFIYRWQSENVDAICSQMINAYTDGKEICRNKGKEAQTYLNENNSDTIVKEALFGMIDEEEKEKINILRNITSRNTLEREVECNEKNYRKYRYLFHIMCQWMQLKNQGIEIADWLKALGWNRIAIYGMGAIGQDLLTELRTKGIDVIYGIDRNAMNIQSEIPVCMLEDKLESVDGVIVTSAAQQEQIKKEVHKKLEVPVVSLKDILDEMQYLNSMSEVQQ